MVLKHIKGVILVFVIGLGIVGNIFVFVNYVCSYGGTEMTSVHTIHIHLAVTNIVMIVCRGTMKITAFFDLRNFLGDVGCKMALYLERVARGLSVCSTCLLTVVQAIAISPRASGWRRLQLKSARHSLPLFLFFWMLNSLISMNLLFYVKNISSINTSQVIQTDSYCYFLSESWTLRWVFLALMVLRDALFQGVMGGASGYMVFLLHKHHQQVLYLRNSRLLCKTPPELKATHSVLLLMLCYLLFYWAECLFFLSEAFSSEEYFIKLTVQDFLSIGYAVLSPFVLIHRDERLAGCWCSQ